MLNLGVFVANGSAQHQLNRSRHYRLLAVVCVLLLAVSSTVQIAHSHENGSADHCQLCFSLHSALPATSIQTQVTFSFTAQFAADSLPEIPSRFWIIPFANGPPSLSQLA